MCGIAGIVSFDGARNGDAAVRRMTRALAHRGPDGESIERLGPAQFGHRRLAIRDLSDAGRQPLFDPSGSVMVVFNGEIYNDAELRREITRCCDYRFRSQCDAEVLPIGWRLWGEELFGRLEGMFAIAIWDAERQVLALVRDRVGIKPLYYAADGERCHFGSEVKAILASGAIADVVDPQSFATYFATGYPDPDKSLVSGIRQVPPGCHLLFADGRETVKRYWQPKRQGDVVDPLTARSELHQSLSRSCTDLLLSDVPVGLMLSSGIDSAVIAMLLRGRNIPALTAKFDDASFDESTEARRVAAASAHPWEAVAATGADDIAGDFRAVARAVDGELADSSALAHYSVSRGLRRHVKVALAGDGADEFLGGYETYFATRIAHRFGALVPRSLAALASRVLQGFAVRREDRLPASAMLARFFGGLAAKEGIPHAEWRRLTLGATAAQCYTDWMLEVVGEDPLASYRQYFTKASGSIVDRALLADQRYYLPGDMLAKVDRISMAHGLEIRVPYLERSVMELSGRISADLLVPGSGPTKWVLRDLAQSVGLPPDLVSRKKRGFNVPIARLLRQDLRVLGDAVFSSQLELFCPMLKPDAVRTLWTDHQSYRADHSYTLWALLVHAVARASR